MHAAISFLNDIKEFEKEGGSFCIEKPVSQHLQALWIIPQNRWSRSIPG